MFPKRSFQYYPYLFIYAYVSSNTFYTFIEFSFDQNAQDSYSISKITNIMVFFFIFQRFSTSLSFSLKIFFNSPKVDSIFSSEKGDSDGAAPRSVAIHEFNSLTVLSSSFHSFTKVSDFFIHSSETTLT